MLGVVINETGAVAGLAAARNYRVGDLAVADREDVDRFKLIDKAYQTLETMIVKVMIDRVCKNIVSRAFAVVYIAQLAGYTQRVRVVLFGYKQVDD